MRIIGLLSVSLEMERLWAVLILICVGRNVDGAEPKPVYFVVGKNVTLRPPSGSQTIDTGVIWRHYEDFAAEWSKGDLAVEYYRDFKGRTVLDTNTGVMVIRDMTERLAGVYSVEINNRRLEDDKYVLKSVKEPSPEIELECEWNVTEKAGPVEYWWKTDQSWVKRDKTIVVTNNETTQRVETFSCKISNIAGEAESKPWPNPFYLKDDSSCQNVKRQPLALAITVDLAWWNVRTQ
uniref:Ig-like domain-containing protein n=1 Tax=Neogobius melanostomus TaxID=47308 RepID=A0A8C6SES8_9GOBI